MDLECFYKLFWDRRVAPGALVTIVSGVGGCDLRFRNLYVVQSIK